MKSDRDPGVVFDAFVDLWQKLLAEVERPGTVVVVEGERDRRSIRRLGWEGPVVIVHRGRTLSATAHALAAGSRRVILLTDWDAEGGSLARRLREFLEAGRLELDVEYRRRLARILRGEVVHVEGLYGWARRTAEKVGRTVESIPDADSPAPPSSPTG
jgi:5S rRNA maturation endonuclease (ribonuclease M5)